MPEFIRNPKDFWTGILFIVAGLAAIYFVQDLPMGNAGKMGPAYFPSILGGLLGLIGLVAVIRSFIRQGEAIHKLYLKELAYVTLAVFIFGLIVRGAGFIPAIVVIIFLSAYASKKFNLKETLITTIVMCLFSVLIFVKLLSLPIPILGPWLGF